MRLVCRLIEEVEGEFCPSPREEPPPYRWTGRMYAPQKDSMDSGPDGSIVADTRRHRIVCARDGGVSVEHSLTEKILMSKEGKRT